MDMTIFIIVFNDNIEYIYLNCTERMIIPTTIQSFFTESVFIRNDYFVSISDIYRISLPQLVYTFLK